MNSDAAARLADTVRQFVGLQPTYELLCELLEQALLDLVADMPGRPVVSVRCKTLSSLAGKFHRNQQKYSRPFEQITDLAGGRILAMTEGELAEVCRRIENSGAFIIDVRNSLDALERLKPMEFGYRGRHFVMEFSGERINGRPVSDAFLGKRFEVQVKTILQHAWAEVEHDRAYKARSQVPPAIRRELGRVAALLERADQSFQEMSALLDRFADDAGGARGFLEEQLDVQQAILEACTNNLPPEQRALRLRQDPALPLRIARLGRALGKPGAATTALSILADEGHAECMLELGIDALRQDQPDRARELLSLPALAKPGALPPHLELQRLLTLAESHLHSEPAAAGAALSDAARLAPCDPQVTSWMLECALVTKRDADLLPLMQGAIVAGLQECHQRISFGVQASRIRFDLGRLELYRCPQAPWEAMSAYAAAIAEAEDCTILEQERLAVGRILAALSPSRPARHDPRMRGFAWAEALLQVAGVAKARKILETGDDRLTAAQKRLAQEMAGRSLKQFASANPPQFQAPVLIVAGGADGLSSAGRSEFIGLLSPALADFAGAIIGGGTVSGISGVAADVAIKVAPQSARIGYVPARRPAGDAVHPGYSTLIELDDSGYTPLGPLQTWADLLQAGVPAEHVRLLGFNGGALSMFEFQLALACGARVATVRGSGRKADELQHDPFWRDRLGLAPIPGDPAVARAVVHAPMQGKPGDGPETNEWIESSARALHEQYREIGIAKGWTEPRFRPWELLPDSLKRSNRHFAGYARTILQTVGLDVRPADADDIEPVLQFTAEEINRMAPLEHGRYVAERLLDGWRLGEQNDPVARTNPTLVAWDHLTPENQEKDRDNIRLLPRIFAAAGWKIVRLKAADGGQKRSQN